MKKICFIFLLLLMPTFASAKTVTCTSDATYIIGEDVYDDVEVTCSEGEVELFAVSEYNSETSTYGYVASPYPAVEGKKYSIDFVWTGEIDSDVDTLIVDGENETDLSMGCETGCHLYTKDVTSVPGENNTEPATGNSENNETGNTEYTILEGANQTYYLGSNASIVIKASGPVDKLQGVEIDNGNPINPSNYEITNDGLAFKLSFLEGSSLGVHTITFKYDDGEVETYLIISEPEDDDDDDDQTTTNPTTTENTGTITTGTETSNNVTTNPQTADNVMFYISMLGLSILVLSGIGIYTKKKFFS